MKKYVIAAMVAAVALSVASPVLASNGGGRGEGHWKNFLNKIDRSWKDLDTKGRGDRDDKKDNKGEKSSDTCRVDSKSALNTAMRAAHEKFMEAKKAARLVRTTAIVAANGDQTKIDAAWSAYQTAFVRAWTTYGEEVFTSMKAFGAARGACNPNPTVTVTPSSNKAITSFKFTSPQAVGSINESSHTIALTVPYGTIVTNLVPTIHFTGATVSSASGVAKDFTNPVTYVVKAADNTLQSYVVTVTVAPNTAKAITSFSFGTPAAVGVINESASTITVNVPNGTDVTSLIPTIVHTGASIAPSSGVAHNFTSPVAYTVTPASGTAHTYVVTVNVQ